jgi:Protein of unknown function (DUF2752)
MHVKLIKRKKGEVEYGIIYGGVSLVALFMARTMPVLSLAPPCIFRALTGIPCPTCGATHSVVHLAQGEVSAAFMMNPLTTVCLTAAVIVFFYSLVALSFDLPKINIKLSLKEETTLRVSVIILILVQWVYLITAL